uniref:(northern house mosquito) hypothetical protein n=1 Tax=Culex pipiens TaxID=7175 RepID=A0A8D8FBU1_CULPI
MTVGRFHGRFRFQWQNLMRQIMRQHLQRCKTNTMTETTPLVLPVACMFRLRFLLHRKHEPLHLTPDIPVTKTPVVAAGIGKSNSKLTELIPTMGVWKHLQGTCPRRN